MKHRFDFVNIAGNAFSVIMDNLLAREYEINVSTAVAHFCSLQPQIQRSGNIGHNDVGSHLPMGSHSVPDFS